MLVHVHLDAVETRMRAFEQHYREWAATTPETTNALRRLRLPVPDSVDFPTDSDRLGSLFLISPSTTNDPSAHGAPSTSSSSTAGVANSLLAGWAQTNTGPGHVNGQSLSPARTQHFPASGLESSNLTSRATFSSDRQLLSARQVVSGRLSLLVDGSRHQQQQQQQQLGIGLPPTPQVHNLPCQPLTAVVS
ncbi:unnamed protein product [Protopolystoma xenopodis]|uniref:Uncharacterized protein n=1 Tax=Protopolystoma xenopodis TaxID=117903 RepID=A0A448X5X7_9PLAT|nr:unnamed protein product [Protopolystoma xenopodis]